MIKTFIVFILMLTFLISIHELGHLLAAKWAGVYCYEYSIGMGPLIYQRKGKETNFSIRALPIGGYVAMAGEQEGQDEVYPGVVVPPGRRLNEVSKPKRAIVLLAGVTMNIIVAFVLMYVAILLNGGYNDTSIVPATIANVVEDSPAQKAGLEVNDSIINITLENGQSYKISKFDDLSPYINDHTITLTIQRDDQQFDVELTPQYDQESQRYLMGIQVPSGTWHDANLFSAVKGSYVLNKQMSLSIINALSTLFTKDGLNNVSGVIGVYQATDQVMELGFITLLMFIAMFSLNLAIFNLLPLPALDGGRVLLLIIEVIIGHPLNKKFETGLIVVSFALLMLLTIVVTCKDIVNLFV